MPHHRAGSICYPHRTFLRRVHLRENGTASLEPGRNPRSDILDLPGELPVVYGHRGRKCGLHTHLDSHTDLSPARSPAYGVAGPRLKIASASLQILSAIINLAAQSLVWGAMVTTVAAIYLEQQKGIALALQAMLPRWFRLACITIWTFVIAWLPIMSGGAILVVLSARLQRSGTHVAFDATSVHVLALVAIIGMSILVLVPLGIWLSLRYLLANAACAYEGTTLRQSLKRSVQLGKGSRWQLLGLVLVAGIIQIIIGIILSIPMWVPLHRSPSHPALWVLFYTLFSSFIVNVLGTPILGYRMRACSKESSRTPECFVAQPALS